MKKIEVAAWNELQDRTPAHALVANVDLVLIRYDDEVSVFYGRCLHRGALLSDGCVEGEDLICGVHQWDYRLKTGVSSYNNAEALHKFAAWVEDGGVFVDEDEVETWELEHPQPYRRDEYQGVYADIHGTIEEAVHTIDPPAGTGRTVQNRAPRSGLSDGNSEAGPAPLGGHPGRRRPAVEAAEAR